MQRPVVLAVLVILLLMLSIVPPQRVNASQAYSERLTAYVAGDSALWYMSFDGINATAPGITAAEGVAGVSWYNLTMLKTSSWSSDFQVFGPSGYNLIPVPFVPSQGAFLTVGADSYATALSAAESFDSYLFASFVSYSNSSGVYKFYTPLSFSNIAPVTLLKLIPAGGGGFANAISASAFVDLGSPIASLQGVRQGSGFGHNLTLGSIAGNALSASSQPEILTYFGSTLGSLQAANESTSSVIHVRFLDGPVNSSDSAAIIRTSEGSGSYTLSLAPKQRVYGLNVTVNQTPDLLLVRRVIDRGVLTAGQNVSVTISLSNPSGTASIKVAGFSDDWWKPYGFFRLVRGNYTLPSQTLSPGATVSPTYLLEYTGTGTQQITAPPASINYTYSVGTMGFKGTASSNPVTLSLGKDNPVVYAFLVPTKNSEGSVGTSQRFNITVKNVGTLTAPSNVVAGRQEGGLLAGSSIVVPVVVTAQNLTEAMSSKAYSVSYSSPSDQNFTTTTNSIPILFTHNSMNIGMPTLTVSPYVTYATSGKTNLTLAFAVANGGTANLTGFTATETLPAGLTCGEPKGSWVSCSGGKATLSPPTVAATSTLQGSIEFDLSSGMNYFFAPFVFRVGTGGLELTGESNAAATPSGVVITKQFVPASLFGGMNVAVQLKTVNRGPFAVYNVTLQSQADSFDAISLFSPLPLKAASTIGVGGVLNVTYKVFALGTFGNFTSTPATAALFFGGFPYALSQPGPIVSVYKPLLVSVAAVPSSPTEGRPFSIGISIQNPSAVSVSDIKFSLPVPSSIALSSLQNAVTQAGNLTVSVAQLGPGQTSVANATGQASSGVAIQFSKSELTFTYSGATIRGPVPNKEILVGEDVLTRYTLPSVVVLIGVLAVAFYVRRRLTPISLGTQS